MDIRRCSKEELDAINERARVWKAQQAARELPPQDREAVLPESPTASQLDLFPTT